MCVHAVHDSKGILSNLVVCPLAYRVAPDAVRSFQMSAYCKTGPKMQPHTRVEQNNISIYA